jgi:hypothetical protein
MGWTVRDLNPGRRKEISLFSKTLIQPPGKWVPSVFSEVKRQGYVVDQTPPTNTEVKNKWSYTSLHPSFMASRVAFYFFIRRN